MFFLTYLYIREVADEPSQTVNLMGYSLRNDLRRAHHPDRPVRGPHENGEALRDNQNLIVGYDRDRKSGEKDDVAVVELSRSSVDHQCEDYRKGEGYDRHLDERTENIDVLSEGYECHGD